MTWSSILGQKHQWSRLGAILTLCVTMLPSCAGKRRDSCSRLGDCDDGICSSMGFCEAECAKDEDCPCGSFCSTGCGVCLTNLGNGPATCFAITRGLTPEEILGACPVPNAKLSADASTDGSSRVQCELPPVTVAGCKQPVPASPPPVASGTGGSAGEGTSGGSADAAAGVANTSDDAESASTGGAQ